MKLLFLFTGTIQPARNIAVALSDPYLREQEYIKAIKENIKAIRQARYNCESIFVENSEWEGESIYKLEKTGEIRVIRVTPSIDAIQRGKGACELDMISKALIENKHFDYCVKITGRLSITNLQNLLCFKLLSAGPSAIVDIDPFLRYVDTRIIIFGKSFLQLALKHQSVVDDRSNYWLERYLRDILLSNNDLKKQLALFPQMPRISGKSGSVGCDYPLPGRRRTIAHAVLKWLKPWRTNPGDNHANTFHVI